ncbi:MAG: class I SAM-dependent methyltransferase [Betaproteobacteria bacterium]|nr:class I SAM-dependent methyltransferase [Betaproteobacteria bacterium]
MSTARRQLALQAAAALAVLSLSAPYYFFKGEALPWREISFAIGICAFLFAVFSRQSSWWWGIHALFAPLAWRVAQLEINPSWFLAAFIVSVLIFRGAARDQIPLYLSTRATAEAVASLMPEESSMRCVDLGAGFGSLLRPLAALRPKGDYVGIENAPLTWLIGRLMTLGRRNISWRWGDLWSTPLSGFDLVYVFLSPAPMPELWEKALREMRPGALLVSNSFPVPELEPESIIELDDFRQGRLYCYRR